MAHWKCESMGSRMLDHRHQLVNNISEEEEDYDKGLPKEEDITYYIHYCPEDDSYLEGMDYNWEEYLSHNVHPVDTNECQEVVEEAEGSQDYPDNHLSILEDEPSVLEAHDQEEDGHYCHSKRGYQDCYPMEASGNTSAPPYHLRCGDGDLGDQEDQEDQEEDINPIRSLSMTSITSASEASMGLSRDLGTLPSKTSCSPSRHKTRPKSLNLPPEAKHHGDPQRGFKPKIRPQRRG
ncbi:Amyloid-beta A4 precursor protein-binding A member 2 [Saguinus oedipus]|uniref:Amyloid-beta A4 protein-binding A member 2 n=1 Tax=Saguinus oedipus TaxID=9490 RepID=A0ABQ9VL14_SAGOE|nr:Amyloid-beta A4 precursor protein-binding A member 2 [Saguinus oedipus]